MKVVPEGGSLFLHNMTMVIDGHTTVEHAVPVARVYDDVVQLWSQTKVGLHAHVQRGIRRSGASTTGTRRPRYGPMSALQRFVPRRTLDARARRPQTAPDGEWNHIATAEEANKLHRAGVSVQIGAHGQREGLGSHWDIWSLVQGGMAPLEALRCATLGGARTLGFDGDLGIDRAGQAGRPARAGPRPAREHPRLRERFARDAERPSLRRRHDERDRVTGEEAREVLVGVNVGMWRQRGGGPPEV